MPLSPNNVPPQVILIGVFLTSMLITSRILSIERACCSFFFSLYPGTSIRLSSSIQPSPSILSTVVTVSRKLTKQCWNFIQDKLVADQDRFSKTSPLPMQISLIIFSISFISFLSLPMPQWWQPLNYDMHLKILQVYSSLRKQNIETHYSSRPDFPFHER